MTAYVILLALHALSVMFWVGSLVSITRVMSTPGAVYPSESLVR